MLNLIFYGSSIVLCYIKGGTINAEEFDDKGIQINTLQSPILIENQAVTVNCIYSGPGSHNISWRIYDPVTQLEPFLFHGSKEMIPKIKNNSLNSITLDFYARRDLEHYGVECAIKKLGINAVYRIPRIQRLNPKLSNCETAYLVETNVGKVNCYVEGGDENENLSLIFHNGSITKEIADAGTRKISTFRETLYTFLINGVTRIMDNTPYQCVTKTIGIDGRNLTFYSKVKGFIVYHMNFLTVPDVFVGTLNQTTLMRLTISVNPTPKKSDFKLTYRDIYFIDRFFEAASMKILNRSQYFTEIEVQFGLKIPRDYFIVYDGEYLRVTSKKVTIKLINIRTPEESLHQKMLLHDQVKLLLFVDAEAIPATENLFFFLENPTHEKNRTEERVLQKYVTYKMNKVKGVCKVEIVLIPEKTGTYRFEMNINGSRVIGPRYHFEVKQKAGVKDMNDRSIYLVLLIGLGVPTMIAFLLVAICMIVHRVRHAIALKKLRLKATAL